MSDPSLGCGDWESLLASRLIHGLFMRTLWALCILRNARQSLIVEIGGQVNVRAQQVEVAAPES